MPILARDEIVGCGNPKIDVYFRILGSLVDMYEVKWRIFDKTSGSDIQVEPLSGYNTLNLDLCSSGGNKLDTGHYCIEWQVPSSANFGQWKIEWKYRKDETSLERSFCEEFSVEADVVPSTSTTYCSVNDARGCGIPESVIGDSDLEFVLNISSRMIERLTGRFFEPRSLTIRVDGSGSYRQQLNMEIISISQVRFYYEKFVSNYENVLLTDLIIYNRHISQGLFNPDDRNNPKIEFNRNTIYSHIFHLNHFPVGNQNVEISGVFGYTDYDGTSTGSTPIGIKRLCILLTKQYIDCILNGSGGSECFDINKGRITSKRTRDKSVSYLVQQSYFGFFSDNPEIERLVGMFKRLGGMSRA